MPHTKIDYNTTPDDFARMYIHSYLNDASPELVKRVRTAKLMRALLNLITIPLAVIGAPILVGQLKAGNFASLFVVAFSATALVYLILVLPEILSTKRLRKSLFKAFSTTIRKPPGFASTGPTRLEATPEGLHSVSRSGSVLTYWPFVNGIVDSSDGVLINMHNDRVYLIPRTAETAAAGLDQFIESVKCHLLPDSEGLCIAAFASDAGLACPKCRVPFGEPFSAHCTECGNRFTMEPLLEAWKDPEKLMEPFDNRGQSPVM